LVAVVADRIQHGLRRRQTQQRAELHHVGNDRRQAGAGKFYGVLLGARDGKDFVPLSPPTFSDAQSQVAAADD
jgi:hypothetical protein